MPLPLPPQNPDGVPPARIRWGADAPPVPGYDFPEPPPYQPGEPRGNPVLDMIPHSGSEIPHATAKYWFDPGAVPKLDVWDSLGGARPQRDPRGYSVSGPFVPRQEPLHPAFQAYLQRAANQRTPVPGDPHGRPTYSDEELSILEAHLRDVQAKTAKSLPKGAADRTIYDYLQGGFESQKKFGDSQPAIIGQPDMYPETGPFGGGLPMHRKATQLVPNKFEWKNSAVTSSGQPSGVTTPGRVMGPTEHPANPGPSFGASKAANKMPVGGMRLPLALSAAQAVWQNIEQMDPQMQADRAAAIAQAYLERNESAYQRGEPWIDAGLLKWSRENAYDTREKAAQMRIQSERLTPYRPPTDSEYGKPPPIRVDKYGIPISGAR